MSAESDLEINRAMNAAKALIDGRLPGDNAAVMVTLDHAIAAILLMLYEDPRIAAGMLNEGLVPRVEERLTAYSQKRAQKGDPA